MLMAGTAWGAMWFFDMGTADSKVWEGATRVTRTAFILPRLASGGATAMA